MEGDIDVTSQNLSADGLTKIDRAIRCVNLTGQVRSANSPPSSDRTKFNETRRNRTNDARYTL